jgi:hypothetical protein
MKTAGFLLGSALLAISATGQAKNVREDPFAYEEREAERSQKREEAEEEAATKQSFGSSGDFAISVERLVGFAHTSYKVKLDGPDDKVNINRIHGLMSPGGDPIGYSAPRIAFDIFVTRALSLGIAAGYGQNTGDSKVRVIAAAPRIGYALMFGDVVGIWPRLGATYESINATGADAWVLAGTFDLPLVLVAGGHAMLSLGPRVDWGFAGQIDRKGDDKVHKLTSLEYGGSAGMTVFF